MEYSQQGRSSSGTGTQWRAVMAERAARAVEADKLAAALDPNQAQKDLRTTEVAKVLGVSTGSVRSAIERGDLSGHQVSGSMGYGPQNFWRVPAREIAALVRATEAPAWLVRARKAWEASTARQRLEEKAAQQSGGTGQKERPVVERVAVKERRAVEMVEAREAVRPGVPVRRTEPATVVFHAGPTNSGKTHDALDALVDAGAGVYAAPLRMLAGEAFERLSARLDEGRVGLVTGEERINACAPIICCTAEMAPMHGELLVLDEVHWASDPERGWAWTRLLLGAEYQHIHIVGAFDALPIVRAAFPTVDVVQHERLCPLEILSKPLQLSEVPDRAAVVAFSRKAVYHVAGMLEAAGRHPVVLYGAMPPGARRSEIASFIAGEADVVVATDVIGHGVNLPVSVVLFAETAKYDGEVRRNLWAWEVAQIAGRAGRFGYESSGKAGALVGIAGLSASPKIVAKASTPLADVGGGLRGYRRVEKGRLAPVLDDLGATEADQLPARLLAWSDAAVAVANDVGWIQPASVADLVGRLAVVERAVGLRAVDLGTAWHLARSPLDPENVVDAAVLARFAHAIVGDASLQPLITSEPSGSIEELEVAGRQAAALRWFSLAFPGVGSITHNEVVAYEAAVAKAIIARLRQAVTDGVAHCSTCGRICAPWSHWCDTCYQQRRYHQSRWQYDEDYASRV